VREITNEKRKLLQSKESSAGGVLAGTIGGALPNRYQLLVERNGLVYRLISGVRTMSYNCSACVIRGIGLCFHLSVGDKQHNNCVYCNAGIAEEHTEEREGVK
jgi:hypothetical protein